MSIIQVHGYTSTCGYTWVLNRYFLTLLFYMNINGYICLFLVISVPILVYKWVQNLIHIFYIPLYPYLYPICIKKYLLSTYLRVQIPIGTPNCNYNNEELVKHCLRMIHDSGSNLDAYSGITTKVPCPNIVEENKWTKTKPNLLLNGGPIFTILLGFQIKRSPIVKEDHDVRLV